MSRFLSDLARVRQVILGFIAASTLHFLTVGRPILLSEIATSLFAGFSLASHRRLAFARASNIVNGPIRQTMRIVHNREKS
jgi:hypothetical protein